MHINLFIIGLSQRSTFRVCHFFPCHPRNAEKAAKLPFDVIEIDDSLPFEFGDEERDTMVVPEPLIETAAKKHANESKDKMMERFEGETELDEESPYQPPATRFC